ncbi:MAG: prepilin peptidase [Gemmataceae bacterium]
MYLLNAAAWPLLFICLGMITCAVVDWWKFKVPNVITLPLIITGWIYGMLHDFGLELGDVLIAEPLQVGGQGGILAALGGTFLGMGLLYPLYMIGGVGAGDVKMQMGFGSWVCAYFGWNPGWLVVVVSYCAGVIVGGILSAILIVIRGEYKQNMAHVHVILAELMTLGPRGHIKQIHDQAQARKPRWHMIPYGVPLCLGFVGFMIAWPYMVSKPANSSETGATSVLSGKSHGDSGEQLIIAPNDSTATTKRV